MLMVNMSSSIISETLCTGVTNFACLMSRVLNMSAVFVLYRPACAPRGRSAICRICHVTDAVIYYICIIYIYNVYIYSMYSLSQ